MISSEPEISVLIPAHERPEKLTRCLEALAEQDFPQDLYEVIVCDDGTEIPLEEQLAASLPSLAARMKISIVRQAPAGPGAARNRAAALARGRLVAFTDDDCIPAPDWLSTLVAYLTRHPSVLIGGELKNAIPENPYSVATQLINDSGYRYRLRRAGTTRFFTTSNMAMSVDGFRKLGGFSETFRLAAGEDYDFSARWQHRGLPTAYLPGAVVHHRHLLTLRKFVRQHVNYGRGLFRVRQMMARRNGGPMRVSPPGLYLALVSHAFQQGKGARRIIYAGLVVLSQVATLAGASYEAIFVGGPAPDDPEPWSTQGGGSPG